MHWFYFSICRTALFLIQTAIQAPIPSNSSPPSAEETRAMATLQTTDLVPIQLREHVELSYLPTLKSRHPVNPYLHVTASTQATWHTQTLFDMSVMREKDVACLTHSGPERSWHKSPLEWADVLNRMSCERLKPAELGRDTGTRRRGLSRRNTAAGLSSTSLLLPAHPEGK